MSDVGCRIVDFGCFGIDIRMLTEFGGRRRRVLGEGEDDVAGAVVLDVAAFVEVVCY